MYVCNIIDPYKRTPPPPTCAAQMTSVRLQAVLLSPARTSVGKEIREPTWKHLSSPCDTRALGAKGEVGGDGDANSNKPNDGQSVHERRDVL